MAVRGLIFDLYGTLVTTGGGWRAYRELINSLPPWKWSRARRVALTQPLPSVSHMHAMFEPRRGPRVEQLEQLVLDGLAQVECYADSIPTLERARAEGLRIALLSNLATPYKQPVFELGLAQHFDLLVFSCDVGMAKPERKIFVHTSRELGLDPGELVMIGDSRRDDIRGARKAGIRALQIDREGKRGQLHELGQLWSQL